MKKVIILIAVLISLTVSLRSYAQNINWMNLKEDQKHLANIHAGWDYGSVFGAGYSYNLNTRLPALLSASYTFSAGSDLFDDFKVKTGIQTRIFAVQNFQFSASVKGIYRRYENPIVRLQNFGSEFIGIMGYYRSRWYVAGEFGFDKAIVTHFKHSDDFREMGYAEVKDGWYQPATGGNFLYGLQAGISVKRSEVSMKIGKVINQDFETTSLIPAYLELSYTIKL